MSTSPRPRAGAGLTHSPVTSTAPPGTTPTSRPTGGKAQGGPWLQQQETLSLPVGQVKGSTRSLCPPSSATRTTASSTGVPGQMVLMNAIDTWNTFGGQHSLALHPDTPKCLPCLPSTPPSKSSFECWPQKQGRSQSRPPNPSSTHKLPQRLDLHHLLTWDLSLPRQPQLESRLTPEPPLRFPKTQGYRVMLVGQGQLCQEGAKSWGGWVRRPVSGAER